MELQDLINHSEDGQAPKKDSPLKSLERDLKFYSDSIKEVSVEIMAEGLSAYPIFVAHQHEVKLGEIILDRAELNTSWTVQASMLEEFVEKGIVLPEKKDRFIKYYKDPDQFMCLFVVVEEGANFVFFPYQ